MLLATSIAYGEESINDTNSINQNSNNSTTIDNKILEYKFEPFLILDGKGFKDISHNDTLSLRNFAIAAWIKTNQTNFSEPAHLVNKGGFNTDEKGENMNYGIWFSPDGTISGGFENESGEDFEIKSTSKYNDGKWHYILLSYDGSLLRLDIDGKKEMSTTTTTKNTNGAIPDTTGNQPLRIGANSLDKDKFFTGDIDEVRVWNRGLTGEEISEIYNNNAFDSKGLIVYLNFGNDEISTKNNISSSLPSSSSSTINDTTKSIGNLTSTSTTTTTNNGSVPTNINETTSSLSSTSSTPLHPTLKTNSITITPISPLPLAQKDEDEDEENDDKLVVRAHINLQNIDLAKTKYIRVAGFINGEGIKQDIPISSIDTTKKILNVDLKVNKENDIVEADTPDEFFICAYQKGDIQQESNSITKFDCNEGDLFHIDEPTETRLFSSDSQVYADSVAVYNQANLNKLNNIQSDTVKLKILVPLADKKDTEKLVIGVMIKGQIQSEVIDDVQAELDKSDGNTISTTFTFDRDTDIGKIQIGDRFHSCVAS
ncbi:MAG TPA: LamG domain-containing protein, partial [Nitrososphaeraceae archaeon]|nr:LamG domain-containing protein [Nitrososphaeraceae archaeon]